MNRQSFLKAGLAVGALCCAPFIALSKWKSAGKGIKVDAGKDRFDKPIKLFEGDTFYTKVSTDDTNGNVFVFESSREKEGGPALHLHYEQDEYWYILEGTFAFKIGEDTFTAKQGDMVFGPRNVPHAFSKTGNGTAKMLMFYQPAGKMEDMFKKISEGFTRNMTAEEEEQFRHEHGIKRVGPPLQYLKKW